jgi:hypothetical protein
MDLLCSACAGENPVINELLTTPWLDGTVSDYITLSFTPFPLPYHIFAFQVAQIVPYLMDLCISDSSECLMDDYRNFCYANYASVLSQVDLSLDDFIPWWTAQVAEALDLDQATLESLYGSNDVYNSNQSTRDFWKLRKVQFAKLSINYHLPNVLGISIHNPPKKPLRSPMRQDVFLTACFVP